MDFLFGWFHGLVAWLKLGGVLAFAAALYLYFGFCLWAIANKLQVARGWLGLIPIANLYLLTQLAGVGWWWMLVLPASQAIPQYGLVVFHALAFWLSWRMCVNLRRPAALAFVNLIPVVGLIIFLGLLTFDE